MVRSDFANFTPKPSCIDYACTYSFVDRLGGLKVDDVEMRDGLRQLTQQEDDDDDNEHHL